MRSELKTALTRICWVALVASLCGCMSWLLSATLQMTFYVKDGLYAVEDSVQMAHVDLTENEDWDEHHDQIAGVQRVLFATWVINRSDIEAAAQFYASTNCTLTTAVQVRDEATLVMEGISVPANDSIYITALESYQYLRHQEELIDFLLGDTFCLYCIAEEAPFEIVIPESVAVVVDFTYAQD